MYRDWRLAFVGVAALATACAAAKAPETEHAAPAPVAAEQAPLLVHTTLVYTRLGIYSSVGRPTSFTVIYDYQSSPSTETLPGAWNDATQTLTTDLNVRLKSENLVFVDDPAVAPGGETPMRVGRGPLHEMTCPDSVAPEHVCYLLQLLR